MLERNHLHIDLLVCRAEETCSRTKASLRALTEQVPDFKHLVARLSRIFGFSKAAVRIKLTDLRLIRKSALRRVV